MAFEVGERVEVESESTERRPRAGVIEEVLPGHPSPRYRIRWDDGRESIYTPADSALRAEHGGRRAKRTTARKRSSRARDEQADASAPAGDRKAMSTPEPESDEPEHYYRDEEERIHLLE